MNNTHIKDDIHPIFVVGHPYSGTTLVQLFISAHPHITSGPETHLFRNVLKNVKNWHLRCFTVNQSDIIFNKLQEHAKIDLDNDFKRKIRNMAADNKLSAAVLLDELMRYFARMNTENDIRWLEKTPRHALSIPQITTIFPHARIINVVRDPRDVVSSTLRFKIHTTSFQRLRYCARRARRWNREIKTALSSPVTDRQMLTIRYEDIIENPEKKLKEIMNFLGEDFIVESLDQFSKNYEAVVVPKENHHKNLASRGKIINRRGIWKKRMSDHDGKMVELICNDLMNYFGYNKKRIPFVLRVIKGCSLYFNLALTNRALIL
jgi:hypothetical protein